MRRTKTSLVGTMAVMLSLRPATSARAQSLVMFYNFVTGATETGSVDGNGTFTDLQVFTTVPWTHIAGPGGGEVLFYSSVNRRALTGSVDGNGTFTVQQVYSGFGCWTNVAGLIRDGEVLFDDATTTEEVANTGSVAPFRKI